MFSLLEKIVKYVWHSNHSARNEEDDLSPEELPGLLSFLQCDEEGNRNDTGTGINRTTGKLTYVSGDYCLIDDHYYLDLRKFRFSQILEVGTSVAFSVFRLSEDEDWQINKVFSIGEEEWDDENDGVALILSENEGNVMCLEEAEKSGLAQRRSLVGKVLHREGRDVLVETENIRFSLDEVECNIIPIPGDWLSLEALVELDEETGDLGGKILKIEKASPLRIRLVERGEITSSEIDFAIVNKNILAPRFTFCPGYEAIVGDAVVLQAIESECGNGCSWRAIALAPVSLENRKLPNKISSEIEEDLKELGDKEGMVIKGDPDFGSLPLGGEDTRILEVCNESQNVHLLIRCRFIIARAQSQMSMVCRELQGDGKVFDQGPVPIFPGKSLTFEFRCKPRFLGNSKELFIFTFRGFRIGRYLKVRVFKPMTDGICEIEGRDLYKKRINWGRNRNVNRQGDIVVPGVKPMKPVAFMPVSLPVFKVPDRLWDAVSKPTDNSQESMRSFAQTALDVLSVSPELDSAGKNSISLSPQNYKHRFHTLLHLEEIALSLRMQERDLFGVILHTAGPGGQFLSIEVPDLAEKRPSVLIGDRVLLYPTTDNAYGPQGMNYEGYVHKIFKSEVWLKFNQGFHDRIRHLEVGIVEKGDVTEISEPVLPKWDVSFHFSRTPLRRCHLAVDVAPRHLGEHFLFPVKIERKKPQVYLSESSKDSVEDDDRQKRMADQLKVFKHRIPSKEKKSNDISFCEKPLDKSEDSECKLMEKQKFNSKDGSIGEDLIDNKNCSISSSLKEVDQKCSNVQNDGNSSVNDSNSINNSHIRIPVVERLFGLSPPSLAKPNEVKSHSSSNETTDESTLNNGTLQITSDSEQVVLNLSPEVEEGNIPEHQKRTVKWFNPRLNREQKNAVLNILKAEARPLPYVIFGPPGTGKTMTLVEAILQTLHLVPESRIVVASPSNSSADLIAERILESVPLTPGELVRLIALHCLEEGKISSRLMPYCTTGIPGRNVDDDLLDNGRKLKIPMSSSVLGRHRITIATCITIGQIHSLGLPQGHFTHVFLDEAGQATEPEALIPLGFVSTSAEIGWGQVILAGDPRQLGPVVISRLAQHFGLGKSFLSRILSTAPYAQDPIGFPDKHTSHYNPNVVTRLITNYRSVPDLLSLTSDIFYDGSLIPTVSPFTGREGVLLIRMGKHLPRMKYDPALTNVEIASPLVFHGVKGEECRHEDSPSWYNPMEAVQCIEYIKMLYHLGGLGPTDVGVISPYIEQVKTIRNLITDHCLPLPKVGTVEEFQGQERLVILLSAVRTSKSNLSIDLTHALGFVGSPNRLNVATSRARALLIIIGDPHLLHLDSLWNKLIKRSVQDDSYVGCDLPQNFLQNMDDVEDDEGAIETLIEGVSLDY